jgi:hypothetical protein
MIRYFWIAAAGAGVFRVFAGNGGRVGPDRRGCGEAGGGRVPDGCGRAKREDGVCAGAGRVTVGSGQWAAGPVGGWRWAVGGGGVVSRLRLAATPRQVGAGRWKRIPGQLKVER